MPSGLDDSMPDSPEPSCDLSAVTVIASDDGPVRERLGSDKGRFLAAGFDTAQPLSTQAWVLTQSPLATPG
jgi:hypothetical protein